MIIFKILARLLGGYWELKAKCQAARLGLLKKFYLFVYKMNEKTIICDIDYRSHFDGTPYFPHGMFGVFVSQWATVGKGCVILQGVTIGSNAFPDSKNLGAPVIGDNCFIGAGAAIIGGCAIGNNVRVGTDDYLAAIGLGAHALKRLLGRPQIAGAVVDDYRCCRGHAASPLRNSSSAPSGERASTMPASRQRRNRSSARWMAPPSKPRIAATP
jgi:hypothetical protein